MKLKLKTLLVVGSTMLLFLTLLFLIIRPFFLEDSNELDKSNTLKDVERINNLLNSDMESLNRTNRDWAIWDDSYMFLSDKYPTFNKINLQNDTFENNKINFMVYINSNNELVYQKGYSLQNHTQLKLTKDFYKVFLPIIQSPDMINKTQLVSTDYGITMSSVQSVYKSSGEGPTAGILIMGRMINDEFISEIARDLSLPLTFQQIRNRNNTSQITVDTLSNTKIKGTLFLQNFSKNETYEISFVNARNFYLQKKASSLVMFTYLLIMSIFITLLILVLLNRFILSRIQNLSSQLNDIQNNKDIKSRINSSKGFKDELTHLEYTINNMLSSLEEKHNEVKKLAYYDQLTMLPNRHMLLKEFEKSIAKFQGEIAVLFFDLDGFKLVNDSLGHKIGDALLNIVCERVLPIIENQGMMARFGGDEFVIFLKYKNREKLENIIQKMISEVRKEFHINHYRTFVTASIGISIYPYDGQTLEVLLQNSDIAMYEAKRKGKNQIVFYQDLSSNNDYLYLLELENDLKFALQKNQFELHYQIIVNSWDKEIFGVEALLRWNHSTKGMISPAEFIPIAEEIGIMPSIGNWVLEEAVKQVKSWHNKGYHHLSLAINISKTQMKDNTFIEKLDQVLKDSKLSPSMLQIEITESDIDHYIKEILQFTKELKKRNVKIALDDFGVGTSSLQFLKELPIDVIKIDQNFIKNVPTQSFDTILLSGIFEVMKGLEMDVVVEGIESEEQIDYVSTQITSRLQGFYFSKPLPSYDLEKILEQTVFADKLSYKS